MENPGDRKPADRIPALSKLPEVPRLRPCPWVSGEYNGYSAKTIADAGEALLSTPNVWFGCMWNSTGGKGWELTGDRLDAFRDDPGRPAQRRTPSDRHRDVRALPGAGAAGSAVVPIGGRCWWSVLRVGWCRWR